MKEITQLNLPDDVLYADDHEWVRKDAGTVKIGISDYAQDQLGDIVYVELPRVGDRLDQKEAFGSVESVKAVSELFMPVGGEVLAVNAGLEAAPELVNTAPYTEGWMIEVKPKDPTELDALMSKDAYVEMLKGLS
ncbi:MAG: glycine cleavage system protein GcvH [Deltaproteobacteria bacterium]|nr:glycine cleavage system protein GcvH [Deltaproteobacteria bacterium]